MCVVSLVPVVLKGLSCLHSPSLAARDALIVTVHSQISMLRQAKSAGFQYSEDFSFSPDFGASQIPRFPQIPAL